MKVSQCHKAKIYVADTHDARGEDWFCEECSKPCLVKDSNTYIKDGVTYSSKDCQHKDAQVHGDRIWCGDCEDYLTPDQYAETKVKARESEITGRLHRRLESLRSVDSVSTSNNFSGEMNQLEFCINLIQKGQSK